MKHHYNFYYYEMTAYAAMCPLFQPILSLTLSCIRICNVTPLKAREDSRWRAEQDDLRVHTVDHGRETHTHPSLRVNWTLRSQSVSGAQERTAVSTQWNSELLHLMKGCCFSANSERTFTFLVVSFFSPAHEQSWMWVNTTMFHAAVCAPLVMGWQRQRDQTKWIIFPPNSTGHL